MDINLSPLDLLLRAKHLFAAATVAPFVRAARAAHSYEATREAAMAAFAKNWRQE
jgi:hypothetical protein